MSDLIDKDIVLRCLKSGNLCGTDIWALGVYCTCNACQKYMNEPSVLKRMVYDLQVERGQLQALLNDANGKINNDTCMMCNFLERGDCHEMKDKLRKERDRLLVLATKHCSKEHHDWDEILKIADDT